MKHIPCSMLLLLLLLLSCPSQAEPLVVRTSFYHFPPWKVLDEYGNPDGIDVRFLELVAERMQLSFDYVTIPFKRCLSQLEEGRLDLMMGLFRRPEREEYALFLEPPYKSHSNKAFFVLKGEEEIITRHEDLHSLVIGTQLGEKYYPRFDTDPDIRKESVSSYKLKIKMLLAGRINAYIDTELFGEYSLNKLGLAGRISKARFVYATEQPVYIALSRHSPLMKRAEEFSRVLTELLETGEFQRIQDEFLSQQTQ